MREEILRMEGVRCMRGQVPLIQDLHLSLYKGETMGLLIHHAYRRSCVASLLCGLLPIDAGRIYYNDRLIDHEAYPQLCMRRIAYIGGQSDLIDSISVAENIFLIRAATKMYFVRHGLLNRQATQLLRYFETHIDPAMPVYRLTPLQRITVELVKAYACGARVVLLNDLSRTLSPLEIRALMGCVARLKAEGVGVLLADAYWDVLSDHTDRLSVYNHGRIVKVFRREEYDPAALAMLLQEGADPPAAADACAMETEAVLSFCGICTETLREVSFEVRRGEVVSVLDMDGSGNNQIAALLQGDCALRSGSILLQGMPYARRTNALALARGLGIINENPTHAGLLHDLSVLENLALPISSRKMDFFARRRYMRSLRDHCAALLPDWVLGLPTLHTLDEEMLQRIAYARWQLMRPKAMVLMRPLSVTDARLSRMTAEYIRDFARHGSAVLILSSNATEARQLGGRVLVLQGGRISEPGCA